MHYNLRLVSTIDERKVDDKKDDEKLLQLLTIDLLYTVCISHSFYLPKSWF